MSDRDFTARLDEIEIELDGLRDRIARYRRAMLGSRVAIVAGVTILAAVYTVAPTLGSATLVVGSIACVIGATVWLGTTKSSMEELQAKLARVEAQRRAIFDRVDAYNGWNGGARPDP